MEICDKIAGTKEEFEIYEFNINPPQYVYIAGIEQLYHLIGVLSLSLSWSSKNFVCKYVHIVVFNFKFSCKLIVFKKTFC